MPRIKERRIVTHKNSARIFIKNKEYTSFASNDYLNLSNNPNIIRAVQLAASKYGVGGRASNVVVGYNSQIKDLEERLSVFLGFDRCLLFSSGYMANLGCLQGLVSRNELIAFDYDNHASLYDAALLSRAKLVRYKHLDLSDLKKIVDRSSEPKLIVTDSIFSMSGEHVDIKALLDTRDECFPSSKVLIDDSHGVAVLGSGRGSLFEQGVLPGDVDIMTCGLGKGFGLQGGIIAGSKDTIDQIIQKARSYIYSTSISPLLVSAADASLNVIERESWRQAYLIELVNLFIKQIYFTKVNILPSVTPIQAIEFNNPVAAFELSEVLLREGILAHAVTSPTVPPGLSRLRIVINIGHTKCDINRLVKIIISYVEKTKL